jgi:hypothetical protein
MVNSILRHLRVAHCRQGANAKMRTVIFHAITIVAIGSLGCSSGDLSSDAFEGDPSLGTAGAANAQSGHSESAGMLNSVKAQLAARSRAKIANAAPSSLENNEPSSALPSSIDETTANLAPLVSPKFAQLYDDKTRPGWVNPVLPGNKWVCGLGKVQGNFQDALGSAGTFIDSNTGNWEIGGASLDGGERVNAGANCVTLDRFNGQIPSGQSTPHRWLSADFSVFNQANDCNSFLLGANTWWGDAATIMTVMFGGFYGAGESVNVKQSDDASAPSSLWTSLCQGAVEVAGKSLFIGAPNSGRQAKFRGPGGYGSAATAGEYSVDRGFVTMARQNEAFCYFTSIRGAFAGDGEKAELVIVLDPSGAETWAMRTTSQQGSLTAKARCFLYDQTW